MVPKRRTVVVHSVPDFEDGALAVLAELERRGERPVVLLEDPANASQAPGRALAVPKLSVRGRLHYLTAGRVITTHGVYASHEPPARQTVVNIWHGEPVVKPVGRWVGLDPAVRSQYATSLSNVGKAFRCAELDLDPSQVLVVGAPRNDRMLRADAGRARAALAEGFDPSAVFFWLPTYRAHGRGVRTDGRPFVGAFPLEEQETAELDDWLEANDALLVAKPHPLAALPEPGEYRRIRTIDSGWMARQGLTLYTLMPGADCLITDVSSVWVDYLLLDKPAIFAFPDLAEYRESRGMSLEPYESWIPGPLTADGAQLIAQLERVVAGQDDWAEARREALTRLHRFADDLSTERLFEALPGF